ncbi:ribonuclease H-like domain-containing protein [Tanacetum coccineum]
MSTHPMVTRAKAGIFKPLERIIVMLPTTHRFSLTFHALRDLNWKEAMLDEYNALITNGTWVLVPRPANVNVVRSMWLFKHKFNADGSLSRYKARLVANGRSQQQGIDCDETFSPVVKPATIRTLTASGMYLSQSKFVVEILERANMQKCNPCKTPVDTESKLGPDGEPVTLSRSSAEAEYCGVANVVAETVWLRNLLLKLHTPLSTATIVYCDNVNAVYLSTNPVKHQRTKHIEIDIHFVRDYVASGQVRMLHVPSRYRYADIFTKGLPSALFLEFRSSLNVRRSPVHTEGEY